MQDFSRIPLHTYLQLVVSFVPRPAQLFQLQKICGSPGVKVKPDDTEIYVFPYKPRPNSKIAAKMLRGTGLTWVCMEREFRIGLELRRTVQSLLMSFIPVSSC